MGKIGEKTRCPQCGGEMTLTLEREESGEPKWKGWICSNTKCRHRSEQSFPHPDGVYGHEVFPAKPKVPPNKQS
jgi:hypothetical protein